MKNRESRRIVPVSVITLVVLAVLVVFEALIIIGALEVRTSTIAKVAPWAYEPFLRLVGEHPDSYRHRGGQDKEEDSRPGASGIELVAGLHGERLDADTNRIPDSTELPDSGEEPSPETDSPPPEKSSDEVVPVG